MMDASDQKRLERVWDILKHRPRSTGDSMQDLMQKYAQ